jgi:hypothetical protein
MEDHIEPCILANDMTLQPFSTYENDKPVTQSGWTTITNGMTLSEFEYSSKIR